MAKFQHFFFLTVILSIVLKSSLVYACAPPSEKDIFIARYISVDQDSESKLQKTQSNPRSIINLNRSRFIFMKFWQRDWSHHPKRMYNNVRFPALKQGSLMIGLAHQADAKLINAPFTLFAVSELKCKDDRITLGQSAANYLAWDRNAKSCKNVSGQNVNILDGFIGYDQSHYLTKIQSKYPTCKDLEKAFPAN